MIILILLSFLERIQTEKSFERGPRPKPLTRSEANCSTFENEDGLDIFNLTYTLFTNLPSDKSNMTFLNTNNINVTPNVTIEAPAFCERPVVSPPNVTVNLPQTKLNFSLPQCPTPNISFPPYPQPKFSLNLPNISHQEKLYTIISMISSILGVLFNIASLYLTILLYIQLPTNLNNYFAVQKPVEIE